MFQCHSPKSSHPLPLPLSPKVRYTHLCLLHCWWECKLVQPLWKTVWRFLKKLQIELPYDPLTFITFENLSDSENYECIVIKSHLIPQYSLALYLGKGYHNHVDG